MTTRIRTLVLVWSALACASGPAAAAPTIVGNKQIAWDYLHGDTRLLMIGDSIQNGIHHFRYEQYKDRLQGVVAGPNYPSSPFLGQDGSYSGFIDPSTRPFISPANSGLFLANQTPPTGVRGANPGATDHVGFTGAAGQPEANLLTNTALYYDVVAPFARNATGTFLVDLLTVANPTGTGALTFDVRGLSTASGPVPGSVVLNTQSATTHLQRTQLTVQGDGDPGGLRAGIRLTPGQTPAAGSNLVVSGVRVRTGQPGLQIAGIGWGGLATNHFVDPANCSDADLASYLAFTDTNIVQIWIGQNDGVAADLWEPRIRALIDRYKRLRPGVRFLLESTYDTGAGTRFADYAEVLADIAATDPNVLHLNMYEALGGASFASSSYLADGVHPTVAGSEYIQGVEHALLVQAASAVPEPGAAALGAILIAAVGTMRRRRRTSPVHA